MGFIQCCVMLFMLTLVVRCKTGLKCEGKATCVSIRSCDPIMNILAREKKPIRPSVVSFLRAKQCGFSAGYPMVCCSPIPTNLNILKHSKPAKQKPNGNVKSIPRREDGMVKMKIKDSTFFMPEEKNVSPSFTISTAPPHSAGIPNHLRAQRMWRIEELNNSFDEEESQYDLLRRRRSSQLGCDIEIR